jgi:hypothetical protein
MKKKFVIINALMGLVVLSAILFQSIHSLEHLAKQFSEKTCHHKYVNHKFELNHSHHDWEKCFACEFTFSSYFSTEIQTFAFNKTSISTKYSISYSKEITQFFKGSLFALRAPPSFIV